jgi:Type IV secretion system pilin
MKKKMGIIKNKKTFFFVVFVALLFLAGFFLGEKVSAQGVPISTGKCFFDNYGDSHGTCEDSCDFNSYVRFSDPECDGKTCCVKRECSLNGGQCKTSRPAGYILYANGDKECKADIEMLGGNGRCYVPIKEEGKCKDGIAGFKKANCIKGTTGEDCKKAMDSSATIVNGVPQDDCIDEKGEGYICCASSDEPKEDKCKGKEDGESCTTETIGKGECKSEKCVKKIPKENACNKKGGTCVADPCKDPFPQKVDDTEAQEACKKYNGEEGISKYACCKEGGEKPKPAPGATTKSDYGYKNPLDANSLTEWIYNLLGSIQGIVGWLAVIMIVLGGVIYILSGGRESQTTLAKSIILWALVGFAIAVAAPALMKGIKDLIAGGGGGSSTDIIDNANSVKQIITNILTFLLGTIGVLALISFAAGGLMYLFSGGDSKRTDTAKGMILYSIIAIAVSGAGVILLRQVMNILEANA